MSAPEPLFSVFAGAATDTGRRRATNEDSHVAAAPVFLVADGMGGHHAGEIASAAVIDVFARFAGRESVAMPEVREAFSHAKAIVQALPEGAGRGAGTTLSGAVLSDVGGEACWLVVNVGDSRTYLLSDGEFEQISVDHSLVQELIDSGQLDEAAAAVDSRRNVITRAIGGGGDSEADFWLVPAAPGDRVLVCSDGLTGELTVAHIEDVIRTVADPHAAALELVRAAVEHGGRDNVTAVVVDARAVRARTASAPVIGLPDDIDADTKPRATTGGRAWM